MTLRPRKLSLQLTPLLDLMLIVFFLQYVELWEREDASQSVALAAQETLDDSREEQNRLLTEQREMRTELQRLQQELAVTRERSRELETHVERLRTAAGQTESDLALAQARQSLLGELVVKLFRVPQPLVDRILDPRRDPPLTSSPEELAELREEFQRLASSGSGDMVRHILTYAEVLKRADIWEVHFGSDPTVMTLESSGRVYALSPPLAGVTRSSPLDRENFERELFALLKSLPQPKGLVLVLLTYDGNQRNNVLDPARDGIRNVLERMRVESGGRSQFEFADLGIVAP